MTFWCPEAKDRHPPSVNQFWEEVCRRITAWDGSSANPFSQDYGQGYLASPRTPMPRNLEALLQLVTRVVLWTQDPEAIQEEAPARPRQFVPLPTRVRQPPQRRWAPFFVDVPEEHHRFFTTRSVPYNVWSWRCALANKFTLGGRVWPPLGCSPCANELTPPWTTRLGQGSSGIVHNTVEARRRATRQWTRRPAWVPSRLRPREASIRCSARNTLCLTQLDEVSSLHGTF